MCSSKFFPHISVHTNHECISWINMTHVVIFFDHDLCGVKYHEVYLWNQDGGVGRHTAPPRTTRTNRKQNCKEVRHQVDKKETFIQTGRRGGDGQPGGRGLLLLWREGDWRSVGRTGQAV